MFNSSSSQRAKQDSRKATYKATVNLEDGRRKREDAANGVRKTKKDELMAKKRNFAPVKEMQTMENSGPAPTEIQQLYINQVNSNIEAEQLEGTVSFRKLLSIEKNPPIDQVIQCGVVPRFVQFLATSNHSRLRFEAAWAITNIASGNAEQTEYVLKLNVVPLFISLLSTPDDDLREQAVWALGNIAGDSAQSRNFVIENNVLEPLLRILNYDQVKPSMLRNAVWLLSNLCRGKPQPAFERVAPSLPVLARLINHHDNEVIIDSLWALSYLSDGNDNNIQAVVNAGVIPRIIQHLSNPNANMQTPALRCLGNIVTGNDQQTQLCIDSGFLQSLKLLLGHSRKNIRKEAAWAISNITAGTKEQTQMVLQAGIIPHLVQAFSTNEFDVKKEAAYAISNATSWKAYDQINFLVENQVLRPMVDLLESRDTKVVTVALECLENILVTGAQFQSKNNTAQNPFADKIEEVDGIDKLEALQEHANEEIYQKSVQLLETYFAGEEEGAENMAPTNNNQTYAFNPQVNNTGAHFSF